MRLRHALYFPLLLLIPYSSIAQKQKKKSKAPTTKEKAAPKARHEQTPVNTFKNPEWAPKNYNSDKHIYFPDYQTFYDPHRGYIVWEKDSWVAMPSMPLYLKNADLQKSRIQILEDLSLDMRPELNYPRYMKMYPAAPGSRDMVVPVPRSTSYPGTP